MTLLKFEAILRRMAGVAGKAGRKKLEPPPMTYEAWVAAGHPPMELSVGQMAMWLDLSKPRINQFCQEGRINRVNRKISTSDTQNFLWLKGRENGPPPARTGGYSREKRAAAAAAAATPVGEQWTSFADGETELDLQVILDAIGQMNLAGLSGAAVQKIQRLESALKTRVERDHKRGQLIDRGLVSTVFSRMYQIESNEFRPLGAKLSPDISAELGVEDPAVQLSIEKRIDGEVLKILAHIKRLLGDFLKKIGAGELV